MGKRFGGSVKAYGVPRKPYVGQKRLFDLGVYDVLDLTAGYRGAWHSRKLRNMGNVLFLDFRREVTPDIVADNTCLPFKDNAFKWVFFDPPHIVERAESFYRTEFGRRFWAFKSRSQMIKNIYNVGREAARVAKCMVLKWTDTPGGLTLGSVLGLLDRWTVVRKSLVRSRSGSKNRVWWVWLERKAC